MLDYIDSNQNPNSSSIKSATPFIKWVGGKTQLLNQLNNLYPLKLKQGKIKKYFELFLGGGAVFFNVIQTYRIEQAFLCDINQDLILTYQVIQQKPQQLIEVLLKLEQQYYELEDADRKELFYQIRNQYNSQKLDLDYQINSRQSITIVALMLFLNKTCFNGLYRTNKKGEFNVPFGRYKKPKICNPDNLLAVSKVLANVTIKSGNYQIYDNSIDKDSFVYIDPPYRPISPTSSFTSYSQVEFNDDSQIKLSKYYKYLDQNLQAKVMLSNSDPQNIDEQDTFFETLYQGYNINKVFANRMVNSNANKRGKVSELVITNY